MDEIFISMRYIYLRANVYIFCNEIACQKPFLELISIQIYREPEVRLVPAHKKKCVIKFVISFYVFCIPFHSAYGIRWSITSTYF